MTATGKNILFISYDGMTDPLGQSQVIPYLQGLQQAGYHIHLLSCEKPEAYAQHKGTVQQLLEKSGIDWMPLTYTKNPPVVSTLLDVIKLRKAVKAIHRKYPIDLVHTRPGVPALVGLWMKKKWGVKFLNDIREFYADSRVEGGMWNTGNPLYKIIYTFFKRKETEAVRLNDGIVCLTHAAETIIRTWPEFDPKTPLQVIPCSADLDLFDPSRIGTSEREALQNELGIGKEDVVISYLGSIGGWYLVDEMMRFCKTLCDKMPSAKLLFISPHRHDDIRQAAARFGIDGSKLVLKKAGRKEVPRLLSLSTYSVFFIKPCYSKQSSSPTKHGEIMAMGIPLITNSGVGDVEMIVNRYRAGIIIERFTNEAYEQAAQQTVAGLVFDAAEIRRGATEFYSLDRAIEKYIQIYKSILG